MDSSSGVESLGAVAGKPDRFPVLLIENGRVTRDGGVYGRDGIEKIATLGTGAKVNNIEGFETDAWQIVFTKSGTKIFQSKDPDSGVFYNIGVTRTLAETDFFFPKRKSIYAINRTDSFLQIAVSTVVSVSLGGFTLDLRAGDGADFATSGTFYVRGIPVTYSGKSTDQLTGCTGLTAAMVLGDIVTQTTAHSNNPKGTCMGELDGSGLVGGVSADATGLYFSEPSSNAEPELFHTFPATYVTPLPRDITAIKSGSSSTLIGMRKGLKYTSGFEPTVGTPVINNSSTVHSIPNAFCIEQTDEDFMILTQEGRILPVGQTDSGFKVVEDPRNPRNDMDYPIQGFMQKNADKSDGSSNFIHYDTAIRTVSSSVLMNEGFNKEIVLQRDIGAWSVDIGKNVACKTLFKGKTYCGSDTNDEIYLDNTGRTDNTIPINFRMVTGVMSLDERRMQFDLLGLTLGGLLTALGKFTITIVADGEAAYTADVTADELISKGLMSLSTGIPIGQGNIGSEQIGSGGDSVEGFMFTYPLELSIECHTLQIEIETFDEGTVMEARELRLDVETESEMQFNTF